MVKIHRIGDRPIIHRDLSARIGNNLNGPSLIRRPAWAPGAGRYMLYFAHHTGDHIRLAFADSIRGPWQVYEPGVLRLRETPFAQQAPNLPSPDWAIELGIDGYTPHVASPDVHLDAAAEQFEMLFHGLCDDGDQRSYLAVSRDGLAWEIRGPAIEQSYMRRFEFGGEHYAMALGGQLMRSTSDGDYELGRYPLPGHVRHVAVIRRANLLHVLYTRVGDAPERLLHSEIELQGDWQCWTTTGEPTDLMRPSLEWEGASLPAQPSKPGPTPFSNALRDPALFEEDARLWLVYAGGGEAALGLAEVMGI